MTVTTLVNLILMNMMKLIFQELVCAFLQKNYLVLKFFFMF